MDKNMIIKLVKYRCYGTATIRHWGGGMGTIAMDPYDINKDELTDENIIAGINDGQFGCEAIIKAEVDVYEVYEYNIEISLDTYEYYEDQIKNSKRGV